MLKSFKRLLLVTSLLLITLGLSGCGVRYVSRQGSQENPDTWSTVSKQKKLLSAWMTALFRWDFKLRAVKLLVMMLMWPKRFSSNMGLKLTFSQLIGQ